MNFATKTLIQINTFMRYLRGETHEYFSCFDFKLNEDFFSSVFVENSKYFIPLFRANYHRVRRLAKHRKNII